MSQAVWTVAVIAFAICFVNMGRMFRILRILRQREEMRKAASRYTKHTEACNWKDYKPVSPEAGRVAAARADALAGFVDGNPVTATREAGR
jgi:lysyl-tRNA synthetase class I